MASWPISAKWCSVDPKAGKYKPTWKKGVYLGKDASGHDVLGTSEEEVTRTKALRRTSNLWSAEDVLALKIGPWDSTGYTYSQAKPTPLPPVLPQLADVDAAAVANYKGGSSEEEEDSKEKENISGEAAPELGSGGDIPTIPQPPVQLPDESPLKLLRPSTSGSTSQGGASSSMDTDASVMKRLRSLMTQIEPRCLELKNHQSPNHRASYLALR